MQVADGTSAAEGFLYGGVTYHYISCLLLVISLGFCCNSDRLRLLEPVLFLWGRRHGEERSVRCGK